MLLVSLFTDDSHYIEAIEPASQALERYYAHKPSLGQTAYIIDSHSPWEKICSDGQEWSLNS